MNFFMLLMGHLWGDYCTQTHEQAWDKKSRNGWGLYVCTVHCLLYSICIVMALYLLPRFGQPLGDKEKILVFKIFSAVFVSHFVINRYNLVKWWVEKLLHRTIPAPGEKVTVVGMINLLVYVVVDNTFHLTLLLIFLKFLWPEFYATNTI